MARLAHLLDGNNGTLSMTLGLGDPVSSTYLMGEARLILGRQINEPSLYAKAGTLSPSAPYVARAPLGDSPGGGDGAGSGASGGEASDAGGTEGSGNDGGDGGAAGADGL